METRATNLEIIGTLPFTRSMLKELLRGICYYISNSATYKCFALTCKFSSVLAKEYAPLKMAEFCTTADVWYGNHGVATVHVLPNYAVHGWSYWSGGYSLAHRNGQLIAEILHFHALSQTIRRRIHVGYYYFKGVLILDHRKKPEMYIRFLTRSKRTIVGHVCPLCDTVHTFVCAIVNGMDHAYGTMWYARTCLEKDLRFMIGRALAGHLKRLRIAKLVIQFALKQVRKE